MREDVGLEWLTRIYGQYALVLLAQSFAPELRGKQRNASPSMFHQCLQVGRSPWFRWRTPPELAVYSATLGRRRNNLYKTGRRVKRLNDDAKKIEFQRASPFERGKEGVPDEVREGSVEEGHSAVWDIQQFIVYTPRKNWPVVEE